MTTPLTRRTALGAAASLSVAPPITCAARDQTLIIVGGKSFTEQLILAELTAQLLRVNDFRPDQRTGFGSTMIRQAMETATIDVYWEYTGMSLITYNRIVERLSPDETYRRVRDLDAQKGIIWLDSSRANNTYAFAVRRDGPGTQDIGTLGALAAAINGNRPLVAAVDAGFADRRDGLPALERHYGFQWPVTNVRRMESGLTYQALRDRRVDAALVFSTDGRIAEFGFRLLEDDRNFFPPYILAPNVRREVLDRNPQLAGLLNRLSAALDVATMARLNAAVDLERRTVQAVAAEVLRRVT